MTHPEETGIWLAHHVEFIATNPTALSAQDFPPAVSYRSGQNSGLGHLRRANTDRLDVINLRAWLRGERDRMHVIHVPSPGDEASRQLMRERGQLQKKVLQRCDRMRKLQGTLGRWDAIDHRVFANRLERGEVRSSRCAVTTRVA